MADPALTQLCYQFEKNIKGKRDMYRLLSSHHVSQPYLSLANPNLNFLTSLERVFAKVGSLHGPVPPRHLGRLQALRGLQRGSFGSRSQLARVKRQEHLASRLWAPQLVGLLPRQLRSVQPES